MIYLKTRGLLLSNHDSPQKLFMFKNEKQVDKIESKNIDIKAEIEEMLKSSKIPSQKEKEDILSFVTEFQSKAEGGERLLKTKEIIEEYIRLKEGQYIDQRAVFKEKEVVNKSYIKEIIKNSFFEGNKNVMKISIDVEGLKTVNDIMGHEAGDIYLVRVHEEIEKTIEEIKEANKEICEELDFVISTEGGDEFGILVIGKKDGRVDLANQEFKQSAKDKNGQILDRALNGRLNDNLNDIDTEKEGILDIKKVDERFKKIHEIRFQKTLQKIEENLKDKKKYEKIAQRNKEELLRRIDKTSLEEVSAEEGKRMLFKIIKESLEKKQKQKLSEIDERFAEYEFFASASSGESIMSELLEETENQELVEKKIKELLANGVLENEARVLSEMDLFLRSADNRMNSEKDLFKLEARQAVRLGDKKKKDNLYKEGRKLSTHMLVISRSDEQMELLLENEDMNGKIEELNEKIKELKEALNNCEAKLR